MFRIVIVLIVSCWFVPTAHATCMVVEDGCSVCCSGPDAPCSNSCAPPVREWDPDEEDPLRRKPEVGNRRRLDLDVGTTFVLDGDDHNASHGITVTAGYHRFAPFRERIIGNELGVELAASYVWTTVPQTQVWIAPVFRVARKSRFRTTSLVGALLPGVGWRFRPSDREQIMYRWSPYPIDFRIRHWLAIGIEPITINVGIGGGYSWWFSSAITIGTANR